MLKIALRKMIKNKWLVTCLFLGCLLSVALFTSLPAYSRGVLQRMIHKEFETRQMTDNTLPLIYQVSHTIRNLPEGENMIAELDQYAEENMFEKLQIPATQKVTWNVIERVSYTHLALEGEEQDNKRKTRAFIGTKDFEDHIDLIAGHFPAAEKVAGEYEVLISDHTMYRTQMMLGSLYNATNLSDANGEPVLFRVVGVYTRRDLSDPFWFMGLNQDSIYLDPGIILTLAFTSENSFTSLKRVWSYSLDYSFLKTENVDSFYQTVNNQIEDKNIKYRVNLRDMDVLDDFFTKREEINLFTWVLITPIIVLLAFYIAMISNLIYDHDRVEISLIKSRGASRGKVFTLYVWQSFILAALALAAGIPLGIALCTMLGSANGFLQFVGRTPLDINLRPESIISAFIGAGLFLISMLLPILFARDGSIVSEKRKKSARRAKPFYERFYLDILMLALSLLGFNFYESISTILTRAGMKAGEVPVNPFLFLISVLFIFGSGLFFSRIYPYLIRFVFHIGKNKWPPALYSSLIGASRARSRIRFLMIFLVMTVSLGIFDSVAARTINQNREDRINYATGADIRLEEKWRGVDPNPEYDSSGQLIEKPPQELLYSEPSFDKFLELDGIETATRVYRNTRTSLRLGRESIPNVMVMAIEPDKFSSIAWNRNDLYDYSINHMMNALIANPYTVLLSSNLMEEYNLSSGDPVAVTWKNNTAFLQCDLYDGVDYFPTFDPSPAGTEEKGKTSALVVMNYNLVRDMFRLEPYEIWIKCKPGVSPSYILEQLNENKVSLTRFEDISSQIMMLHNDPMVQGMNGNLTLSFLITIIITATGFMIFWIIDLKSRQLQLGIIRSLGMSQKSVIAMLLWEQLLLSVIPLAAGLGIGNLTASIFVPMFEFGSAAAETVPPFHVFALPEDFLRVAAIVMIVILAAIFVLAAMVSKMKMSQTLKLGED